MPEQAVELPAPRHPHLRAVQLPADRQPHPGAVQWPADRQPQLRVVPMPSDSNPNGDVFGGWVMSHVDLAGAVAARARAGGPVATVAVNSFVFKQPVSVGDVVSFYADIVKVGRTSITLSVEVYAQRETSPPVTVKVTEALLTYVARDRAGQKREIPPQ